MRRRTRRRCAQSGRRVTAAAVGRGRVARPPAAPAAAGRAAAPPTPPPPSPARSTDATSTAATRSTARVRISRPIFEHTQGSDHSRARGPVAVRGSHAQTSWRAIRVPILVRRTSAAPSVIRSSCAVITSANMLAGIQILIRQSCDSDVHHIRRAQSIPVRVRRRRCCPIQCHHPSTLNMLLPL